MHLEFSAALSRKRLAFPIRQTVTLVTLAGAAGGDRRHQRRRGRLRSGTARGGYVPLAVPTVNRILQGGICIGARGA